MASGRPKELHFGVFRLYPGRRLLQAHGRTVRIGNRALDILLALIERPGEVVTNDELIARAWPGRVVDETNLRTHIAALRRALRQAPAGSDGEPDAEAERYILNVSGRGYSFVGALWSPDAPPASAALAEDPPRESQLPAALTRMIGRDAAVDALLRLVPEQRLVTIVGTGGVGKSTLALAAAAQLQRNYAQGAWFIDLAAISEPAAVPVTLATVIGLAIPARNPTPDLLAFLRDRRMLFVVDNCEHVIAAAAELLENMLRSAPGVDILATSREPLGVEGEYLQRLAPLELPPAATDHTAAEMAHFPAVQLFMERARTGAQSFALTDANADTVGDICRRLDGIPLAIELAASRLNLFGVNDLAQRLDRHFLQVAQRRRTAAPRHQTLHATLAWSYDLLSPAEQCILRRLAAFNGAFSLESAVAVAAHGDLDEHAVIDGVQSLSDKSLLATQHGPLTRHRLLYTTRTFALDRLAASADSAHVYRWHAEHHRELLQRLESEWETMPKLEWITLYGETINDIRAALDWAFAPDGDGLLGAELTIAAVPFSFQLALMEEFRQRVEQALAWLERHPAAAATRQALPLQLNTTLQMLRMNSRGISASVSESAATVAELSQRTTPLKQQLEPLINEAIARMEMGDYRAAVATAEKVRAVAQRMDDPLASLLADRVLAQTLDQVGSHAQARALAERVIAHHTGRIPLGYHRLAIDPHVSMRVVLSRTAWLEGFADRARHMADAAIDAAASEGPFAQCLALGIAACPVALWCGDFEAAERYLQRLFAVTARFRIEHWQEYGECYERVIRLAADAAERRRQLETGLAALPRRISGHKRDVIMTIDPELTDDAPRRYAFLLDPRARLDSWCAPEILRVLGELLARDDAAEWAAAGPAENLLQRALGGARAHGALAWELRCATSLARLWQAQDRGADARRLLEPIYLRFTEGHHTRDLRQAGSVLESL